MPDLSDVLSGTRAVFSTLNVPERVTIRDVGGETFTLPALLPARRQAAAFRELEALFGLPAVTGLSLAGQPATLATLVRLIARLVMDEQVVAVLGRAFVAAHPQLAEGGDPLDRFPVEELVAALMPSIARFLQRGGALVVETGRRVGEPVGEE